MSELGSKTVLVWDNGLFIPIAEKLSHDFGRVLYHNPWQEGFSSLKKGCIGDGYSNIEKCLYPFDFLNEVDLWVFPDIGFHDVQIHLESQGFPVWGARDADEIELDREIFLDLLEESGLDVPNFVVLVGMEALRDYLKDEEDKFVKISQWRGDLETTHWRNWELDSGLLDLWASKFGAVKELVRFLVFDPIDTEIEIGSDTYCIDGQWPNLMLHGVEWKDKSYFAAVTPFDKMPEQIQKTLQAFSPILSRYRYRNEFSTELRVQGDKSYFIDPTCRGGLPSTGSQMEIWSNFAEIIWAGAHGVMVQPEPAGKFSMECVLTTKRDKGSWTAAEFPESLSQWAKPSGCCMVGGLNAFPPNDQMEEIGWLVAIGDTPEETLEAMKEHVSELPDGVSANIESLVNVIKEIETAEAKGIPFTSQRLPEPSSVVED